MKVFFVIWHRRGNLWSKKAQTALRVTLKKVNVLEKLQELFFAFQFGAAWRYAFLVNLSLSMLINAILIKRRERDSNTLYRIFFQILNPHSFCVFFSYYTGCVLKNAPIFQILTYVFLVNEIAWNFQEALGIQFSTRGKNYIFVPLFNMTLYHFFLSYVNFSLFTDFVIWFFRTEPKTQVHSDFIFVWRLKLFKTSKWHHLSNSQVKFAYKINIWSSAY